MNFEGKLTIKNIAYGRLILGVLTLDHEGTFDVDSETLSEQNKKDFEHLIATKQIEIYPADVEESKEVEKASDVITKESVKNEKGETHSHSVYDPETASKNRAINVEEVQTSKAIVVEENRMDYINFLEKHWKTVEKELENITSVERLKKLLSVAEELGMKGNKKYELIKDRIAKI
jgi:hypothetical protein